MAVKLSSFSYKKPSKLGPWWGDFVIDDEAESVSLTNAIDERLKREILPRLGFASSNPNQWEWLCFHTDGVSTEYKNGRF